MESQIISKQLKKEFEDEKLFSFYEASQTIGGISEDGFKGLIGADYVNFLAEFKGFIIYEGGKFCISEDGINYLKDHGYIKKNSEDLSREQSARMITEGFAIVDIEGRILKINRGQVVDYIFQENPHIFTLADTEEIYVYRDGVYRLWKEPQIKDYIGSLIGKLGTRFEVAEIIFQIKYHKVIVREKLNTNKNILNFRNGLYDLSKNELTAHDPAYLSTLQFPMHYNPSAKCPNIEKFLNEVLEKEQDIQGICELMGYLLRPEYEYQKAWMITGEGCNGKSVTLNLIEACLGADNCSHIPLSDLMNGGFHGAELFGKLANIYADLPDKELPTEGQFKLFTGGDSLTVERKFQNPFSFRNYARLIFSCNRIPFSKDDTKAFHRRWIIIQFNKIINNPDKKLLQKLTTKEELSGFLNLAIEGWFRLIKKDIFSNEKNVESIAEEYMRLSDPAYAFFSERLIPDLESWLPTTFLYSEYINFCRDKELPSRSSTNLFKRLPRFTYCYKTVKRVDGNPQNVFVGLRIRGEDEIG